MRLLLRPILSIALALSAWTSALASFVCESVNHLGFLVRESFLTASAYVPTPERMRLPVRRILMLATSLSGRHVGGVRIHGFLGRPSVRMLIG